MAASSSASAASDQMALRARPAGIGGMLDSLSPVNSQIFPAPVPSYGWGAHLDMIEWIVDDNGDAYPIAVVQCRDACRVTFYFHGNAEDIGDCIERCRLFGEWLNSHVVIVEYPGYGGTAGKATEHSTVARALHAMRYVCKRFVVRLRDVIIFGRSIGTGVAVQVASQCDQRIAGLILQSPFESVKKLAMHHTSLAVMMGDRFDNVRAAEKFQGVRRVLVYHGNKDKVIPIAHGKAVFDAFKLVDKKRRVMIEDEPADHIVFSKQTMMYALKGFQWDLREDCKSAASPKQVPIYMFPQSFDLLPEAQVTNIMKLQKGALRRATEEKWIVNGAVVCGSKMSTAHSTSEQERRILAVFMTK